MSTVSKYLTLKEVFLSRCHCTQIKSGVDQTSSALCVSRKPVIFYPCIAATLTAPSLFEDMLLSCTVGLMYCSSVSVIACNNSQS